MYRSKWEFLEVLNNSHVVLTKVGEFTSPRITWQWTISKLWRICLCRLISKNTNKVATVGKARCWAYEHAHSDYLDMTCTYLCIDLFHPSGHRPNESQTVPDKQHTALHIAHAQKTVQQMTERGQAQFPDPLLFSPCSSGWPSLNYPHFSVNSIPKIRHFWIQKWQTVRWSQTQMLNPPNAAREQISNKN